MVYYWRQSCDVVIVSIFESFLSFIFRMDLAESMMFYSILPTDVLECRVSHHCFVHSIEITQSYITNHVVHNHLTVFFLKRKTIVHKTAQNICNTIYVTM